MAKLTGPLFSLRASATIGKTLTYASWKGIQYVRTRVIPNNPRTSNQTEVRDAFSALTFIIGAGSNQLYQAWVDYTRGKPLTPANAFVQFMATTMRGEGDLSNLRQVKGQGPIPSPAGLVVTPGAGTLAFNFAIAPSVIGWTFNRHEVLAIQDFDPTSPPYVSLQFDGASITPGDTITLTGLPATDYAAGAWNVYKDDATGLILRTSPSVDSFETVS